MDIGNNQSVAIYFDNLGKKLCIQFREDISDSREVFKNMDLNYEESKAFIQTTSKMNMVFCNILAGDRDAHDRRDVKADLVTNVGAKIMP